MGREVRKVPANWQHPTNGFRANGEVRFVALFDGRDYAGKAADWDAEAAKWAAGDYPSYADDESKAGTYEDWAGARPDIADYMPNWPESERTHFMMYETTSEGTPKSPAFATPEELAHWLADNNASAFAGSTASYEAWLSVCNGGWAPDMISDSNGCRSGIEMLSAGSEQK